MKKYIIHIISYPGAGKYTIAKEFTKDPNFKIFDNHIINNVLFCLTDLSKSLPKFKDKYINKLYKVAFKYFLKLDVKENIIFTNFLENTKQDLKFFKLIQKFAKKGNFTYIPVILKPTTETLLSRVVNQERSVKMKLTNPEIAKSIYQKDLIKINLKTKLEIDNSNLTPTEVINIIKEHIKNYD